jgi:two-component system, sensor histidine kinase and response regulator
MTDRILVVDDMPTLLDLMKDTLEPEGYLVSTCLISREAYDVALRDRPDLIMLDIVMPEVSGWEVLERLRGNPELQSVPVVICTAWSEIAAGRLRELQQSHLWLLPKPFDPDELLDTVSEALEAARGDPALREMSADRYDARDPS